MDLFKDSDCRLKGVFIEIRKEEIILGKVWVMMGIVTIEATNYT